jgi:hypothetical protein
MYRRSSSSLLAPDQKANCGQNQQWFQAALVGAPSALAAHFTASVWRGSNLIAMKALEAGSTVRSCHDFHALVAVWASGRVRENLHLLT